MCFTKTRGSRSKIAEEDIYVIKTGVSATVNDFIAYHTHFRYISGILFTKGWIKKFDAFFRRDLYAEVFHSNNISRSARLLKYFPDYERRSAGVFMIPKGTRYYENTTDQEIASFGILYVGPLEMYSHLIKTEQ